MSSNLSTVAYFDTKSQTVEVIPPNKGGRAERTFKRVRNEGQARAALKSAGYQVSDAEPYPYGTAFTVGR